MDPKKQRKLHEVMRGLIGSGFVGNQNAISQRLRKDGLVVTQSTVSRALKRIGAVKINERGTTRYEIKSRAHSPNFRGSLSDLVKNCRANESTIVVKTTPGSAMFVAGFIDHHCTESIIGSVAGDDTIFLAPLSTAKIQQHTLEIEAFLASFI